jgi:hypothetical protein
MTAIDEFLPITIDGQVALTDRLGTADDLARIAARRTIHAVECRGLRPFVTDDLIDAIRRIPTIRRLEFAYQPITDGQVERLLAMPGLCELHIVHSDRLTDAGFARLRERGMTRCELLGCAGSE